MRILVGFVDKLVKIELALSAVLAFCLGLLVFTSATLRYVVGAPLSFSDELVALMFVLTTFFTLPYAARVGMNIKLDIFTKKLPVPTRRRLAKITNFIGFMIVALFAVYAFEDLWFSIEMKEVTEVAEIPVSPVKALTIFALGSMALALFTNLIAGEAPPPATEQGPESKK
jgi:TRAP-type C4-dicarboxylate transport system permease small subunit